MAVSDDELLEDLCATAKSIGKNTVGLREYRQFGKYDDTTVSVGALVLGIKHYKPLIWRFPMK